MNRLLAAMALAAFIAAMVAIALASATGDGSSPPATTAAATRPAATTVVTAQPTTTAPSPPKPVAVKLTGVGAYDPEGDGSENDSLAPLAADGDPTTYWKTEHYKSRFTKKGVGVVLAAGRSRTFTRVTASTDGAGSSAQILLGKSSTGPFRAVSKVRPLNGRTSFPLKKGSTGRYLVVWVTSLPQVVGEAHITEVRALAR